MQHRRRGVGDLEGQMRMGGGKAWGGGGGRGEGREGGRKGGGNERYKDNR